MFDLSLLDKFQEIEKKQSESKPSAKLSDFVELLRLKLLLLEGNFDCALTILGILHSNLVDLLIKMKEENVSDDVIQTLIEIIDFIEEESKGIN